MSNISSAQKILSVQNTESTNLDIDNYTIDELVTILNISEPTEENIKKATEFYIKKFIDEGDQDMSNFFKEVQTTLIDELKREDDLPEDNIDSVNDENQAYSFLSTDDKDIGIPDKETNERLQAIGIYGNSFKETKKGREEKNPQYNVPIAQGKLNPTLKNITTRMVNIDSKYRTNSTPSTKDIKYNSIISHHTSQWSASNFVCNLSETLMNVVNIQLYSITIPYSWYLIDKNYGNTSFKVNNVEIEIEEGNYSKVELLDAVSQQLSSKLGEGNSASYNSINGKSTITLNSSENTITFYESQGKSISSNNCGPGKKANYNLGWILGFRNYSYTNVDAVTDSSGSFTFTSESFVDVYGPRYLILILDDYNSNHLNKGLISVEKTQSKFGGPLTKKLVDSNLLPVISCEESGFNQVPQYGQGAPRQITASDLYTRNETYSSTKADTMNDTLIPPTDTDIFAILPLKKVSPGDIITEFTTSIQRNERNYFGPVDIGRINVKILDDKGNILNLNGMDWSVILMVQQLYQY